MYMFCSNCKNEIDEKAKFCPYCGEKIFPVNGQSETMKTAEISSGRKYDAVQKKTYSKSLKKILIAVVAIILCIAAVSSIKDFAYKQSDEYKTTISTQLILAKNYTDALESIQDIDNNTAKAIREYVTVLEKRDTLVNNYSNRILVNDISDLNDFTYSLDKFIESDISNDLPARLLKQCSYYKSCADSLSELGGKNQDIINVQQVLLLKPQRKMGKGCYHSWAELKNDVLEWQRSRISLGYNLAFYDTDDIYRVCINDILTATANASEEELKIADELQSKGFEKTYELYYAPYKENPEQFAHFINSYLEPVQNSDDIEKNIEILSIINKKRSMVSYITDDRNSY